MYTVFFTLGSSCSCSSWFHGPGTAKSLKANVVAVWQVPYEEQVLSTRINSELVPFLASPGLEIPHIKYVQGVFDSFVPSLGVLL